MVGPVLPPVLSGVVLLARVTSLVLSGGTTTKLLLLHPVENNVVWLEEQVIYTFPFSKGKILVT